MTDQTRGIELGLEQWLHRELARLPAPRAPRTLLPRVLAAIERPWYARAWRTWPAAARATALATAVALLAGTTWLAVSVESLSAWPDVVRIGWRLLVQPVVVYAFGVAVAFSLTAAASWAALTRVALGGTK
jgi:hypothetical protein